MLQDPVVAKPPDHEREMISCSRLAAAAIMERRAKAEPEQALKCPRCDSTNTKFCYYNNYSLAQPRHFCKNCRRYWTKGGALRNVPIGGGCRKNKRMKHRALDPSSLMPMLDDPSLLASLAAPSTSTFLDLSAHSHGLDLTLSRLQETLRLREQSGGITGSSEASVPELFSSPSCNQPSLMSGLPQSFSSNLMVSLGFPSSANVKQEQEGLLYNSADLCPLFEGTPDITNPTASTASIEHQFSAYSAPNEQVRPQQSNLTLQLDRDESGQGLLPAFEEERREYLRHVRGKAVLPTLPYQCQGMHESYYDTASDVCHAMWINSMGWPEFQALASPNSGGMI